MDLYRECNGEGNLLMLHQYFYKKCGKGTWLVRLETCVSSLSILLGRLLRLLTILLERLSGMFVNFHDRLIQWKGPQLG